MVRGIGGLGFLDAFHCEKISFVTTGGFIGLLYFAYIGFVNNEFPTVSIFNEPITFLYLFALVFAGGYLGVIFYRVTHRKKIFSVDTLKFWDARK